MDVLRPAIATVMRVMMGNGQAHGVAPGTAQISVTAGDLTASVTVTVTAAVPESLSVSPALASILVGATQNFQATVIFSDGTSANVNGQVQWSSSDDNIADISNMGMTRGQATGNNPGKVTITGTFMGLSATAALTVRAPTLLLVDVTPVGASIIVGQTQAFAAIAIWDDGTKQTITNQATWQSSDGAVAAVSNGGGGGGGGGRGVATGLKAGSTTISATYLGVTGGQKLAVRAPALLRIDVTPAAGSVRIGQTLQFQATAVWEDGTLQNITPQSTWQSSDDAVAAVSDTAPGPGPGGGGIPRGTATGIKPGVATIKATWMGKTGSGTLTVSDATLLFVQVTPVNPPLAKGLTVQLTATAVYSDFVVANVTGQATWQSANIAVASVGNGAGASGRVTALAEGSSDVSATFAGSKGTTTVMVTPATLKTIQLTPDKPSAPIGGTVAFTATAVYSDDSTVTITADAAWSSSDVSVATIANGGANRGTATALKTGQTTIGAAYMGMTGSTTLTVRKLVSLAIAPASSSIAKGKQVQLVATATYDDASTQDVTGLSTWIPADPAVAAVSNANDSRGLTTGLATGTTKVDAHFQGLTATATVTVTP